MSADEPKKGVPTVFAVLALLLGGGFAAKSIAGALAPAGGGGAALHDDDADGEIGDATGPTDTIVWTDLLATHGSFDPTAPVRLAFHAVRDAGNSMGAAVPAGETAPPAEPGGEWIGAAPPSLRVGVVMVASHARRAVLAGRVVGIGDVVGEVRVTRIEPDLVGGHWRDRTLTWDLTSEVPREFRAELARRNAMSERAAGAATPPGTQPTVPAPAKGRQEQDR